ncbi:MAG: ABC-F family ATP-binding cassette domain-containing protein [Bacteroidales bacterium]|nr:ABC-F family ATP-binding cassette domain-containing protein [Bacteroidales bacterium]
MNLLSVENLTKSYGEKLLFENISFGIQEGQKTALIAANGTGKSSLLNIIMGLDIPDSGNVTLRNEIRVAYLPQSPEFDPETTILDLVMVSDNLYVQTTKKYELAVQAMEENDSKENQQALSDATTAMDAIFARDYETKVKEVLGRLKIGNLNQKAGTLSGGQLRKVALARVLIDDSQLIILDEPTNHLDIDMIEWLEEFLNKQKLALLLVTHDRYFLDSVCDDIIELDQQQLYQYHGGYSYFVEKKAEREAAERLQVEKARNTYRTELEWMRRMPKARTSKSKARIDAFYELEMKATRRFDDNRPEFQIKDRRMGKNILELNNIHKSFEEPGFVIRDFSHIFKHGERVGVVGANGSGKSTLFRIIMDEIQADEGSVKRGQTIHFGYFSQINPDIKKDKRVIEIVKDVAEEIQMGDAPSVSASQFLHYFGFDHNTQYNYYTNLSGGEKRRLHLCMTLIKNPNFLILDEPTNDLDIDTLNILEEFLIQFKGCLMIATHDRAFLDKIADHIFIFEGDGKIKDYYSNYSAYRLQRLKALSKEKQAQKAEKPKQEKPKSDIRKATYKEKLEFEALQKEIAELESEKASTLAKMNNASNSTEELTKASERYQTITDLLDEKEMRWLELSEIIS